VQIPTYVFYFTTENTEATEFYNFWSFSVLSVISVVNPKIFYISAPANAASGYCQCSGFNAETLKNHHGGLGVKNTYCCPAYSLLSAFQAKPEINRNKKQ
jgi:hypothetical protein